MIFLQTYVSADQLDLRADPDYNSGYDLDPIRIARICVKPEVCLGPRTNPLHFRDAPDYDQ